MKLGRVLSHGVFLVLFFDTFMHDKFCFFAFSVSVSFEYSLIFSFSFPQDLSPEDVANLWLEYHKDKDCVSAVIPASAYATLIDRAQVCSSFLALSLSLLCLSLSLFVSLCLSLSLPPIPLSPPLSLRS